MPHKNARTVLDGETGLVLPEKDPEALGKAIADLARDPARGLRMGEQGFEHVRDHFSAQDHANRIMALYDLLLLRTDRSNSSSRLGFRPEGNAYVPDSPQ